MTATKVFEPVFLLLAGAPLDVSAAATLEGLGRDSNTADGFAAGFETEFVDVDESWTAVASRKPPEVTLRD